MSAAVSTWVYISAHPNQCSCVCINAIYVSLHMCVTHARRCVWIQIVGCDLCVCETEKERERDGDVRLRGGERKRGFVSG